MDTPSAKIISLDEYRKQRIADGTWPPNDLEVKDYWRKRRRSGPRIKTTDDEPEGAA